MWDESPRPQILELIRLAHEIPVTHLTCLQLLLDLLKIETEGLTDLSQIVVLLGSNLRLHAILLGPQLHV